MQTGARRLGGGLQRIGAPANTEEVDGEQDPRQSEGGAKARVEHSDEHVGQQMERTDRDAAGHHDGHDRERTLVEKLDEQLALVAVAGDALGVFDGQLVERHEPEHDADDD